MSNMSTFINYAAAFDQALVDDNWSSIEQFFAPNAVYLPGDGSVATGRKAVLAALKASVSRLERKCDTRTLMGAPDVSEAEDLITLKYSIKYTKRGVCDYILSGVETIQYSGGAIERMEDVFEDPAALVAWQATL